MQFVQSANPSHPDLHLAESAFARVNVNLHGRLMLANFEEYDCVATIMSPGDAFIESHAAPAIGERIVVYLDHLGRVEGVVDDIRDRGFLIVLNATERKRDKLAAQLTWIANKHELSLPEDRRHDRYAPRNPRTEIVLDDGRRYPCRIIDLSLSGAAIDIDVRPAFGTRVTLGSMRGRVVRHFQEGIAIEFLTIQPQDALRAYL